MGTNPPSSQTSGPDDSSPNSPQLTEEERFALIQNLNCLSHPLLTELVGYIPEAESFDNRLIDRRERVQQLVGWAQGSKGPGLVKVRWAYEQLSVDPLKIRTRWQVIKKWGIDRAGEVGELILRHWIRWLAVIALIAGLVVSMCLMCAPSQISFDDAVTYVVDAELNQQPELMRKVLDLKDTPITWHGIFVKKKLNEYRIRPKKLPEKYKDYPVEAGVTLRAFFDLERPLKPGDPVKFTGTFYRFFGPTKTIAIQGAEIFIDK